MMFGYATSEDPGTDAHAHHGWRTGWRDAWLKSVAPAWCLFLRP